LGTDTPTLGTTAPPGKTSNDEALRDTSEVACWEARDFYVAMILSAILQQMKNKKAKPNNLRILLAGCRDTLRNIRAMLRSGQQPPILSQPHRPKAGVCGTGKQHSEHAGRGENLPSASLLTPSFRSQKQGLCTEQC